MSSENEREAFNLSAPNDESQPKPFQNAKESLTLHFPIGIWNHEAIGACKDTGTPFA
jgi:hypothetical protein